MPRILTPNIDRLFHQLDSLPTHLGVLQSTVHSRLFELKHTSRLMLALNADLIHSADERLGVVLQDALIEDPLILKVEERPDLTYKIGGNDITFKVDTGAVTSVLDARNIQWTLLQEDANDQRTNVEAAYEEYAGQFPDHGALTLDGLTGLSTPYQGLSFGTLESFDLVISEKKKKGGEKDTYDAEAVTISNNLQVIGVSNPKVGGVRKGLRPVVKLPIAGVGFKEGDEYPFSLISRPGMTRRGLASRNLLRDIGMSIVFDSRDTRTVDLSKVDYTAVARALTP